MWPSWRQGYATVVCMSFTNPSPAPNALRDLMIIYLLNTFNIIDSLITVLYLLKSELHFCFTFGFQRKQFTWCLAQILFRKGVIYFSFSSTQICSKLLSLLLKLYYIAICLNDLLKICIVCILKKIYKCC